MCYLSGFVSFTDTCLSLAFIFELFFLNLQFRRLNDMAGDFLFAFSLGFVAIHVVKLIS